MNIPQRGAVLVVDKFDQGPMTHYRYLLTTSSEQADQPMTLQVQVPLVADVMTQMCRALQTSAEEPQQSQRLQQSGEILYRLLFPGHSAEARLLVARLKDWQDPLVISTNDVQVPWELLHDGVDFLGIRLALGRQVITSELFQEGRPLAPIGQTRRALIVSNPTEDLGSADDETTGLARFLTDRDIECTLLEREKANLVDVLHQLGSGVYDIFHFSGHVGTDGTGQAGLRLNDTYLGVEAIRRSVSPPDGGPTGIPPVVFLNGCRSAEHLSSVCSAFLDTGSRIIVGTRYRIIDSAALGFAESWYTGLLAGRTVGEALQEARNSQRHGPTGTWASFVLFGQPATQLWEPPPPESGKITDPALPASPEEEPEPPQEEPARFGDPPWNEFARNLDADARRLLRQIVDSVRGFGIVTTFDLAAGLVAAGSALAAAVEAAGIEPLWLTEILTPRPDPDPDRVAAEEHDPPQPSANVRSVLDRAVQLARAGGRTAATVDDVVSAFTETGGGHAGEVLSLLGVDLGTSGSLFTEGGAFRGHHLAPETQRAVYCARLLSATNGEVISSYSLLLGFALSGSPTLREALLDQGTNGEAAVRILFPEAAQLTLPDFSRRAALSFERALEAGRNTGGGPLGDGLILAEVLIEPESTACQLLAKLGIEPKKLRASLTDPRAGYAPAGGEAAS